VDLSTSGGSLTLAYSNGPSGRARRARRDHCEHHGSIEQE
jgi:hypothetical protein